MTKAEKNPKYCVRQLHLEMLMAMALLKLLLACVFELWIRLYDLI